MLFRSGDIYAAYGDMAKAMEYWLLSRERGSDSTTLDRKIKEKKYIKER